jgi:hypothetical protein
MYSFGADGKPGGTGNDADIGLSTLPGAVPPTGTPAAP